MLDNSLSLFDGDISQITRAFRRGESCPSDWVRECLRRIRAREAELSAWVLIDESSAMRQAAVSDERYRRGEPWSQLDGVPFGVKDIIDVAGWPTGFGVSFAERQCEQDAAIIKLLRRTGAIPLGKTATTPFACFDPSDTRNPLDPGRTPGGSSSGSAATVAARGVPFALGTQTGGSVIRPASFCGIYGLKPSFSWLDAAGVYPVSPWLDTLGWLARSAADLALIEAVISEFVEPPTTQRQLRTTSGQGPAPRVWVVWQEMFRALEPTGFRLVYEQTLEKLAARQIGVVEQRDLPLDWDECLSHYRVLMFAGAAESHRELFERHASDYPSGLASMIREGQELAHAQVQAALRFQAHAQVEFRQALGDDEIGVCPSARGVAPIGLESTGDPRMNSLWTLLGWPALNVPIDEPESGMPLGLQMVAPPGAERQLLRAMSVFLGEVG